MIVDLLADLVLKKIHNHLVLSYSGAPYSIGGASSLRGARLVVLQDWVLIFHLAALTVKKQITPLDHEVHLPALTIKK